MIRRDLPSPIQSPHYDPVTLCPMCDPVRCNDGQVYDRFTVVECNIRYSPFTRRPLRIVEEAQDIRDTNFRREPELKAAFEAQRAAARQALAECPPCPWTDSEVAHEVVWRPHDPCLRVYNTERLLRRGDYADALRESNYVLTLVPGAESGIALRDLCQRNRERVRS